MYLMALAHLAFGTLFAEAIAMTNRAVSPFVSIDPDAFLGPTFIVNGKFVVQLPFTETALMQFCTAHWFLLEQTLTGFQP